MSLENKLEIWITYKQCDKNCCLAV